MGSEFADGSSRGGIEPVLVGGHNEVRFENPSDGYQIHAASEVSPESVALAGVVGVSPGMATLRAVDDEGLLIDRIGFEVCAFDRVQATPMPEPLHISFTPAWPGQYAWAEGRVRVLLRYFCERQPGAISLGQRRGVDDFARVSGPHVTYAWWDTATVDIPESGSELTVTRHNGDVITIPLAPLAEPDTLVVYARLNALDPVQQASPFSLGESESVQLVLGVAYTAEGRLVPGPAPEVAADGEVFELPEPTEQYDGAYGVYLILREPGTVTLTLTSGDLRTTENVEIVQ